MEKQSILKKQWLVFVIFGFFIVGASLLILITVFQGSSEAIPDKGSVTPSNPTKVNQLNAPLPSLNGIGFATPAPTSEHPSLSPDGLKLAFNSDVAGSPDIWLFTIDGNELTNLTNSPTSIDIEPDWSPTDPKITFTSTRSGNYDIWIMGYDGTNVVRFTTDPAGDHSPAWSPDGSQLAFVSDRAGNNDIWVKNADGSGLRPLTVASFSENDPAWSPLGDEIVFSRCTFEFCQLLIVNVASGIIREVTQGITQQDVTPSWSQSGIAFSSNRVEGFHYIWLIQPDGTGLVQITQNIEESDWFPIWFSYGQKILFSRDSETTTNIWVTDADGQNQHKVTHIEIIKGDFNSDGCVDRADYGILIADIRNGAPNNPTYDLNNDGAVNRADARTLAQLFTNPRGASCQ